MQVRLIFTVCCCFFILAGCASKDYTPQGLKNYTAQQLLRAGEKELASGGYTNAAKYFEAIEALYPFGSEAYQGQLDVIYAYYKAEDYPLALTAVNRYLHLYPVGQHTDYVYYMKGVINFDKGRSHLQKMFPGNIERLDVVSWREAFLSFDTLNKNFPASIYMQDAHKRMLYIRNVLVDREMYIANFYLKRKAYIAAANRASYVVQHFSGAPQMQEALRILHTSYVSLGLIQQARDVERVSQLNF